MKYIKYFAAALLLTIGLASCELGEGGGTPGKTTVQFAQAVVEEGFGAGTFYVPLTIESDTKEGMNSCSVQAKVKVVTTGEANEGTPDLDGLSGDYRVTSLDINFPAFSNYYNEKLPEEYKTESGKWVKTVYMEVMILNDKPELMNFTFEIESATTTIGEQKQCRVELSKGPRDRLCGTYTGVGTTNIYTAGDTEQQKTWTSKISWNAQYSCFEFDALGDWVDGAYAYWDEGTQTMYMYSWEPIMWYSSADSLMIYSAFYTKLNKDEKAFDLATDEIVVLEYDIEAGTIKFPEDLILAFAVYQTNEEYAPVAFYGYFPSGYKGITLTKK